MANIILSVIVVKYKSEEYLDPCLKSLGESPLWEIIVVDNDKNNIGYGGGCNLGAKKAKGKYLLFLNPDTGVLPGSLKKMIDFLEKNNEVAVLGPKLFNSQKMDLQVTCVGDLDPLTAIFSLSFFNKIFPDNQFSQKYFLSDWDRNSIKEVGAVSGAALMIRKDIFKKIDGFDEDFFLYFEEIDLCRRINMLGKKVVYYPEAGIIHFKGKSSQATGNKTKKYFLASRFNFFKKNYGFFQALLVEGFLRTFELFGKIL